MGRTGEADPLTQSTRVGHETASARSSHTEEWLTFFSSELAVQPTPAVLGAILAAGILFDIAVRSGVATLASVVSIIGEVVILFGLGRARNGHARALLTTVPLFAVWFALRTSPTLLFFNVIACGALLLLGASLARSGSIWDLSVPRIVLRSIQAVVQFLRTPSFIARSVASSEDTSPRKLGGIVRGIALALPLVLLLGALLASADVVFASIFEFDGGPWVSHVVAVVVGALGMGTLLRMASVRAAEPPPVRRSQLGVAEWTIVLGALDVLFAAFAIARIASLSEGGRRVIESAGLTYAEYARSGFFQLLAVAAIAGTTLVTLRAFAATGSRAERRFKVMALFAVVLTLAIVVSAFQRLVLYEDAFGLTMLRLYSHTAIVWVGLALILLGVVLVTRPKRPWLAPATGIAALVLLFGLNVLNPEAFVARHNIHTRGSTAFDPMYLSRDLSDDALPTIADNLDRVDAESRRLLEGRLCSRDQETRGWASFNLARHRANEARRTLCRR